MRNVLIVLTAALMVAGAVQPVLATTSSGALAAEALGGTLGGLAGAAIGIVAIGEITPKLELRAARVVTVISGVTLGGGLGAATGVLATGKLLGAEGNALGCLVGASAGGLLSAFTEPLLYVLGVPEEVTEFLGLLFLPICPAIGAMIGFHWGLDE